jgi:hypothetical protein
MNEMDLRKAEELVERDHNKPFMWTSEVEPLLVVLIDNVRWLKRRLGIEEPIYDERQLQLNLDEESHVFTNPLVVGD